MVDSISGKNPLQEANLLNVSQQQQVEKTNVETAKDTANVASLKLVDEALISDDARKAYESEKEILRFSRLAQRIDEPFNAEKVANLKDMVNNGRINEYLRSINTQTLAENLLNSPSGAFLRSS